jgi:hypothetical protein
MTRGACCRDCGAPLEDAAEVRQSWRLLRSGPGIGCRARVVTLRCACGRTWREARAVASTPRPAGAA